MRMKLTYLRHVMRGVHILSGRFKYNLNRIYIIKNVNINIIKIVNNGTHRWSSARPKD